jgi:hypothetical protein
MAAKEGSMGPDEAKPGPVHLPSRLAPAGARGQNPQQLTNFIEIGGIQIAKTVV